MGGPLVFKVGILHYCFLSDGGAGSDCCRILAACLFWQLGLRRALLGANLPEFRPFFGRYSWAIFAPLSPAPLERSADLSGRCYCLYHIGGVAGWWWVQQTSLAWQADSQSGGDRGWMRTRATRLARRSRVRRLRRMRTLSSLSASSESTLELCGSGVPNEWTSSLARLRFWPLALFGS